MDVNLSNLVLWVKFFESVKIFS